MRAVEQFHRVKRYLEKLRLISAGEFPAVVGNTEDEIFSFFVHCHHLKDWVKKDQSLGLDKKAVEKFFNDNHALRKCRDVSNGHKHMGLDRNRLPKIQPTLGRVSQTITIYPESAHRLPSSKVRATIVGDDGEVEFLELAEACVQAWIAFLKANKVPETFFE